MSDITTVTSIMNAFLYGVTTVLGPYCMILDDFRKGSNSVLCKTLPTRFKHLQN